MLPGQSDRTINELATLSVTNTATDADVLANVLTYTLVVGPTNAAISTNGLISWTPTEAQGPGNYTFTTVVTDNGTPSLSASNSFMVAVNEINSPPVSTVLPPQRIRVGGTLTVTNTATDADIPANLLAFSLLSPPAGMVIDSATGVITWTPPIPQDPRQSSTNLVTVRVTDNGQPPLSDTNSFTVTVVGVGQRITDIQPTNGTIVLMLDGLAGEVYHIQATPTLSAPISWVVIGTNTAGINGLSQFIDVDSRLYPMRFYRSVKP